MRRRRRRYREDSWKRSINRREDSLHTALANVIVVSVPVMVICIAANVIMRMKDVYQYSLNASGILGATTIRTSDADFIGLMTDFLNGKTDTFALMENVEYEPEQIFTALDADVMVHFRLFLNIILIIGILAFIVSFIMYFFLIRWRVKAIFMNRFKIAVGVFAALEAVNAATICVTPLRRAVYGRFIPMDFPDGDNLVILLGDAFPRHVAMFELCLGVAMMIAIGYFTWHVAGHKKMFRRF